MFLFENLYEMIVIFIAYLNVSVEPLQQKHEKVINVHSAMIYTANRKYNLYDIKLLISLT